MEKIKFIKVGSILEHGGDKFKAVLSETSDPCDGCYFFENGMACPKVQCAPEYREDGNRIIFKECGNEDERVEVNETGLDIVVSRREPGLYDVAIKSICGGFTLNEIDDEIIVTLRKFK